MSVWMIPFVLLACAIVIPAIMAAIVIAAFNVIFNILDFLFFLVTFKWSSLFK